MEVLLEILKYILPALIVFFTVWIMLRTWSANENLMAFLEKQKEGKKKMRQIGSVEVPSEAFMSVLKID